MEYDLVLHDVQLVSADGVRRATVAISGGQVADVLDAGTRPSATEHLDAGGLHLLPGLVDTHVHLRAPARPDRETFRTGTAAAAAGGVTTICEMPTSDPPVNSGATLARRAIELQPDALVDYALYGGAAWENRDEIAAMAEAGAVAFKTWLHAPAPGREAEFHGLSCPDTGRLHEVMREVARTGLVHALHCEHEQILTVAGEAARRQYGLPGAIHAAARPEIAEDASVATVLALAAATGARVQPVHVSSAESVVLAAEARARGVQVTVETCPHYLQLDEKALFEFGSWAKCNPPLRSAATVERLWDELRAGRIDVIGTDHCPYRPEEIATGEDDIFLSPPGLPGLETMLPILLTAVHQGRLTMPDVARLTSGRAAEIFDLPAKGRIAPGADADLVLVDTASEWTFRPEGFSKAAPNATFLDGSRFTGRVVTTFVRGQRVFDRGQIVAEPGHGRFVRPDRARVSARRAVAS
ncbi:allantoinase AllB [Amycolatopsis carbonis]|uniref:allantoinase n=1 Tax=Amycolatopsis carbonis TaxID=715471 RepID=A0A9Y2MTP0_9PSEU|nr:allantoinase AllB [Amycolatopsis sp. 2-15]WIX77996.1 allantoinase AllB [Amycolatopsis sp. 2-15]